MRFTAVLDVGCWLLMTKIRHWIGGRGVDEGNPDGWMFKLVFIGGAGVDFLFQSTFYCCVCIDYAFSSFCLLSFPITTHFFFFLHRAAQGLLEA
jgi:hypothetical protein